VCGIFAKSEYRLAGHNFWATGFGMTEAERFLYESLVDLEKAIEAMATDQSKPDLGAYLARVDALAADLPANADPALRHYLDKKSYQKARLFLEGRGGGNRAESWQ